MTTFQQWLTAGVMMPGQIWRRDDFPNPSNRIVTDVTADVVTYNGAHTVHWRQQNGRIYWYLNNTWRPMSQVKSEEIPW